MTEFLDGPAVGVKLRLRRAPTCLRVVKSATGKWDALDQLDDTPQPGETIYVYRRVGGASLYHILCSPRRNSGWFYSAQYRHVPDAPARDVLSDNERWRAWTLENREMMEAEAKDTGATP